MKKTLKLFDGDNIYYSDEEVIHFGNGLPGFEDLKNFLVTTNPDYEPFHWMHSIDQQDIKFVLVNPMLILPDYNPKMNASHFSGLEIESSENLLMYVIVTLNHGLLNQSTANLLAPVMINIANRKGKQIILDDHRYETRHPILSLEGGF
jgi:flagellar assembly factor FliW